MPIRERDGLLQGNCPWAGFGHLQTLKSCEGTLKCSRHCPTLGETPGGRVFSTLTCVLRSSTDTEKVLQKSEGTLQLCLSSLGFARVGKGKVHHLHVVCPTCSLGLQDGFEGKQCFKGLTEAMMLKHHLCWVWKHLWKHLQRSHGPLRAWWRELGRAARLSPATFLAKAVLHTTVHHRSSHAVCFLMC